ncbi:hypothetical protein HDU97_005290 [Phlyctochytrium planicorne]|nr:hypothetical protein HDU97_005290 [Phlyctochytrium planicorne]
MQLQYQNQQNHHQEPQQLLQLSLQLQHQQQQNGQVQQHLQEQHQEQQQFEENEQEDLQLQNLNPVDPHTAPLTAKTTNWQQYVDYVNGDHYLKNEERKKFLLIRLETEGFFRDLNFSRSKSKLSFGVHLAEWKGNNKMELGFLELSKASCNVYTKTDNGDWKAADDFLNNDKNETICLWSCHRGERSKLQISRTCIMRLKAVLRDDEDVVGISGPIFIEASSKNQKGKGKADHEVKIDDRDGEDGDASDGKDESHRDGDARDGKDERHRDGEAEANNGDADDDAGNGEGESNGSGGRSITKRKRSDNQGSGILESVLSEPSLNLGLALEGPERARDREPVDVGDLTATFSKTLNISSGNIHLQDAFAALASKVFAETRVLLDSSNTGTYIGRHLVSESKVTSVMTDLSSGLTDSVTVTTTNQAGDLRRTSHLASEATTFDKSTTSSSRDLSGGKSQLERREQTKALVDSLHSMTTDRVTVTATSHADDRGITSHSDTDFSTFVDSTTGTLVDSTTESFRKMSPERGTKSSELETKKQKATSVKSLQPSTQLFNDFYKTWLEKQPTEPTQPQSSAVVTIMNLTLGVANSFNDVVESTAIDLNQRIKVLSRVNAAISSAWSTCERAIDMDESYGVSRKYGAVIDGLRTATPLKDHISKVFKDLCLCNFDLRLILATYGDGDASALDAEVERNRRIQGLIDEFKGIYMQLQESLSHEIQAAVDKTRPKSEADPSSLSELERWMLDRMWKRLALLPPSTIEEHIENFHVIHEGKNFIEHCDVTFERDGDLVKLPYVVKGVFSSGEESKEIKFLEILRSHPNFPQVFAPSKDGSGATGYLMFFVGHVEPVTLRDFLDRNVVEWSERLKFARQLASAVRFMHSRGIVHGSLHPQNILVGKDKELGSYIKIVDFARAKFAVSEQATATANITGADFELPFMAPELLHQNPTYQSDVYALGVILWEITYCTVPFDYLSPDAVRERTSKGQREEMPSGDVYGAPENLVKLISSCWTAEPGQRPTAKAVQEMLLDVYRHDSTTARKLPDGKAGTEGVPDSIKKWRRAYLKIRAGLSSENPTFVKSISLFWEDKRLPKEYLPGEATKREELSQRWLQIAFENSGYGGMAYELGKRLLGHAEDKGVDTAITARYSKLSMTKNNEQALRHFEEGPLKWFQQAAELDYPSAIIAIHYLKCYEGMISDESYRKLKDQSKESLNTSEIWSEWRKKMVEALESSDRG